MAPADPAAATTVGVLAALTDGYPANFAARLWNGGTWQPSTGPTPFTVVLKHPGAVRAMFWPFDRVGLGEAYIFDDFDIDGDIFAFTGWLRHIVRMAEGRSLWAKLRLLRALRRLPNRKNPRDASKAGRPTEGDHSTAKDREAISYTYDLPGEFYRLFLDKNLQYTCGYFASADEHQDIAQERKLDYVCRKLRLKPGEKYVDFGCGWGGLVIHAAKHYGVHATGVTLAGEQAKWCERAVDEAGVRDRVKIVYADYRDFRAPGEYDKASSVGMGEHIGVKNLPVFFAKVFECLRPGGAYLHHSITLRPLTPYPRWTAFARKYVFPNGELQTVLRVQESAALAGFEIRDVENLREHYVLTLENWVRKLEANREAVLKVVGEVTYRIFRIYMAGATLGFRYGTYGLNQVLASKPADGAAGMPLTRADWYN
ncbi:MAG: class I SAM-dependent methyltransferase [Isosphaera sp.]|nr:class I SAM-dependent methyltransferase [Isosphaera sp.]